MHLPVCVCTNGRYFEYLLSAVAELNNLINSRLAVDMDINGYIHGYIHVWISDFSHPVDISMDIVLSHLLIKVNI